MLALLVSTTVCVQPCSFYSWHTLEAYVTFRSGAAQILSACSQLEELTLRNCTHAATHQWARYSCPFLGATAALLHRAGSSRNLATYHRFGRPPRVGYRGLRELQLHWHAAEKHAHITRYMLEDLAPVPSVSIHADSIRLRVPGALDPVPAALKIVARSMQLVRSGSGAELSADLASLRSRCQLIVVGVCMDEVVASWVPLTQRDYIEDYRAWTHWVRNNVDPFPEAPNTNDDALDMND